MQYEMSTKTSPPAPAVKIKKEIGSDEIKDFAETAMNELLGWYGYDNVDRIELQSKPSRLISALNTTGNHSRNEFNNGSHSHRDDSTTPDHDSSREDSKSPSSTKNSEKLETHCGWCRRQVPENSPEFLTTSDGPRYCSESCFAQSRRASFKRAKTCDWCRHVRHAVSYVDFQDGASQLQFCSDKCLNQYKMQIFCKETQAHLDMNPHLKETGIDTIGGLITPDLWLKNCRSRSASPDHSDLSRSPTPTLNATTTSQQPVHKPIISVAPASKLLSRNPIMANSRQSPKHNRKKRFSRMNMSHGSVHHISNNNNNNNTNSSNSSLTNGITNHSSTTSSNILANSLASLPMVSKPCTFTNVQDLRLSMPPISPIEGPHPIRPNINPSYFSPPPPNAFNLRPPFFSNHAHPRLMGIPPHHQLPHMPPIDLAGLSSLLGTAPPPVTVMVPYPIIIPLPIPIPIPLPIIDFLKVAESRKNGAMPAQPTEQDQRPDDENNEPLDFTKSKSHSSENDEASQKILTSAPVKEVQPTIIEDVKNNEEVTEKEALPKLKITRLNSRRSAATVSRESENSRPLRKRKRVIDCDYLRSSKDDEDATRHKK